MEADFLDDKNRVTSRTTYLEANKLKASQFTVSDINNPNVVRLGGSSTVVEGGLIQYTLENDEWDVQSRSDDDGGGNDDYDDYADDNDEAAACVESDEDLDISKKLSVAVASGSLYKPRQSRGLQRLKSKRTPTKQMLDSPPSSESENEFENNKAESRNTEESNSDLVSLSKNLFCGKDGSEIQVAAEEAFLRAKGESTASVADDNSEVFPSHSSSIPGSPKAKGRTPPPSLPTFFYAQAHPFVCLLLINCIDLSSLTETVLKTDTAGTIVKKFSARGWKPASPAQSKTQGVQSSQASSVLVKRKREGRKSTDRNTGKWDLPGLSPAKNSSVRDNATNNANVTVAPVQNGDRQLPLPPNDPADRVEKTLKKKRKKGRSDQSNAQGKESKSSASSFSPTTKTVDTASVPLLKFRRQTPNCKRKLEKMGSVRESESGL
jgi:hypothetical protein